MSEVPLYMVVLFTDILSDLGRRPSHLFRGIKRLLRQLGARTNLPM